MIYSKIKVVELISTTFIICTRKYRKMVHHVTTKRLKINQIIDSTQRYNNPKNMYIMRYGNKEKGHNIKFFGCIFDEYQETNDKQIEYLILYDIENEKYQRRKKCLFKYNEDFSNFQRPLFSKDKYLLKIYKHFSVFIDFIDHFDDNHYIIHIAGEDKYSIVRKKVIKDEYVTVL